MCSTPNGSGDELEKFPDADAPLPIANASPPDAGMKSLDHCSCSFSHLAAASLFNAIILPNAVLTLTQISASFHDGVTI
jgi:hypothetical protein